MIRKILTAVFVCAAIYHTSAQNTFTPGNLVVLQTSGSTSKASSAVTLKEFTPNGSAGMSVSIPSTGPNAFQTSGVYGGSEGFLTTSLDGRYILLAGYNTAASYTDITATTASAVPRVIGTVAPSGFYLQADTSTVFYSGNDIRGAVSDSTHYWAAGASNASIDGINYFGPGTPAALAGGTTPAKAYGLRIFNGQIYYSTQKAGPSNSSSQLGIFTLGGLPTGGTVSTSQVINTGTTTPEDFSINSAGNICYVAINLNTSAGGIQKWTKSGSTWSLAYTLGTGTANTGAYGLVADYSGTYPVIYATTFESAGNRIIRIVDSGSLATANISTIVSATSNVFYKGITFTPVASGMPVVNLTLSTDTASEAGQTIVIVKANSSFPVTGNKTFNVGVAGSGITAGDYTLSAATITIPNGATYGVDTFRVTDDILAEGTETAAIKISTAATGMTLGTDTVKTVTITDNDVPGPPTIIVDAANTTDFIDGGVTTAPVSPYKVSSVINDPTDPATTLGIFFNVQTTQQAGILTMTATSSNPAVVPNANIFIAGVGNSRSVRITPAGVGYSDITLKLKDGYDSSTFVISLAASATSLTPYATLWHTGMSDGSDGIAIDDNYYISGDDELNVLNVYSRSRSGMPLVSYNYTNYLNLPDPGKPEVDIEAAARSLVNTDRVFWMGSMSNGKAPFDNKPNRDRIFATKISGAGAATTFSFSGYAALRSAILSWGDANGYSFTASAAQGVDSKATNGFAAEGLVFGPDSTTLFIAFRAPLVPVASRTKAVICPVRNFETWFNNGSPSGSPAFGAPIELDLGGRGFRDLIRLSNGTYIIVAGNSGSTPLTGALYKWSGNAGDAPVKINAPGTDTLNMEGAMEVHASGQLSLTQLQIVSDYGDHIFYNDGTEAKDFGDLQYRKFRSDMLSGLDMSVPVAVPPVVFNRSCFEVFPNASAGPLHIRFRSEINEPFRIIVRDIDGKEVYQQCISATAGSNEADINLGSLARGMYFLRVSGSSADYHEKVILK
jgi:hypothetical protein